MSTADKASGSLKRTFGLATLVAFGVGDILGAGIYGLIGKVAGHVGYACWTSFAAALIVAALTGLSYAELGSRLPRSAGEAYFAQRAFRLQWLAYLIGFLVLLSGIVSVSTVSHIFAGYLKEGFLPSVPAWTMRLGFLVLISFVTFWGIRQVSAVNVVCTLVEISGLLFIIFLGLSYFGQVDYLDFTSGTSGAGDTSGLPYGLILSGGVLAFYSFIGFEDMVNVSEEVKDPQRLVPRAILISLAIAAVIYGLTAIAAVSVVPPAELAAAEAPLMLVVQRAAPGFPIGIFNIIALFAVTNTALVNFVMGSRLLYGMANQKLLPSALATVHSKRGTPDIAIGLILVITMILTLVLAKETLAGSTSLILLMVFFVVNLSLVTMKLRKDPLPSPRVFQIPLPVPILGTLATLGLACFVSKKALLSVAILAPCGIVLYLIYRLVARIFTAPDS